MSTTIPRRQFLNSTGRIALFALCPIWVEPSFGQSSAPSRIETLKQISEAMSAAVDALKKLFELLKDAVKSGKSAYDAVRNEAVRTNLIELSRGTGLVLRANERVRGTIEDYLRESKKTSSNRRYSIWSDVTSRVEDALRHVRLAVELVEEENSTFVLKPAYEKLLLTLGRRYDILEKLRQLQPPVDADELQELSRLNLIYIRLMVELEMARAELNKYLEDPETK